MKLTLFTFSERLLECHDDQYPDKYRWSFQLNSFRGGITLGFIRQNHDKLSRKWYDAHCGAYEVGLFTPIDIGFSHTYYDGPHCSLSLGPLHFLWNGNPKTGRCKYCESQIDE